MTGLSLQCPACHTAYLLPPALLGDAGARVRCPSCEHEFTVDASGRPVGAAAGDPHREVAHAVLEELAQRIGPGLEMALAERRLFADHGPAIMASWDEYRRRIGPDAPSHAFREALRARFGVELFPAGGD